MHTHYEAAQAVQELLKKADEMYGTELHGNVRIECNIRGWRTAGQAGASINRATGVVSNYRLRLHPVAIEDHWNELLSIVIPHEVAHLVDFAQRGKSDHSWIWKRICLALGGTGDTTHDFKFRNAPSADERAQRKLARRPYVYTSSKGYEIRVTKQRHNKIFEGAAYIYRGMGRIDWNGYRGYKPVSAPKAKVAVTPRCPAMKKAALQNRAPKNGKTKAEICRELIRTMYGQVHDDILIDKIAYEAKLSKGLAKKYFENNLAKAFQA